ncbi:MAG: DUF4382 domain-containing protein [Saprospiraceae bacterium]|nr:DUF4382 domain-containing protein [Saprospiraceae bacterium]
MLQTIVKPLFGALIISFSAFFFTSCGEDDQISAKMRIEVTDAPIDDAGVSGAFVTVTDVQVDGKSWSGFSGKTTIDLLAYQNGNVALLGDGELEAGSYTNITLVLDKETDANGNSPGCYVMKDGQKKDLYANSSSSSSITLSPPDFDLDVDGESNFVIDFDLRKSIRSESDSYAFVTTSEMQSALRVEAKATTGVIAGNCTSASAFGDLTVAYAYKKGTYNRSSEMSASGESEIYFKNATTSSKVNANGDYDLHFLSEGEYEVVFVSYEDQDQDGRLELKGTLDISILGSLTSNVVSVEANATASLSVDAIGLTP